MGRAERLLAPGERVHLVTREHGVVLARPFARATLLLAACAAGGYAIALTTALGEVRVALLVVLAAVALRAWLRLALALVRWRARRLVVTDRKLVLESGALVRRAAVLRLSQLEDVETVSGGAGRLLRYGGLVVGVGGRERLLFDLAHLPEPDALAGLVLDLADEQAALEGDLEPAEADVVEEGELVAWPLEAPGRQATAR